MCYRQGHHSTSDDSTRYREVSEIMDWKEKADPIMRMNLYLTVLIIVDQSEFGNLIIIVLESRMVG